MATSSCQTPPLVSTIAPEVGPPMRFLPPPVCRFTRRIAGSRLAGYAVIALAAIGLSGCITPAQELNFIDHHIIQRQPARPSPTQVAAVTTPSAQ